MLFFVSFFCYISFNLIQFFHLARSHFFPNCIGLFDGDFCHIANHHSYLAKNRTTPNTQVRNYREISCWLKKATFNLWGMIDMIIDTSICYLFRCTEETPVLPKNWLRFVHDTKIKAKIAHFYQTAIPRNL